MSDHEAAGLPPKARLQPPHARKSVAPTGARQMKPPQGPSPHLKPCSQSYGVGLEASVIAGVQEVGGWLGGESSSNEIVVGEGGAKRGEYEVRGG